jgi:hypothetical protein
MIAEPPMMKHENPIGDNDRIEVRASMDAPYGARSIADSVPQEIATLMAAESAGDSMNDDELETLRQWRIDNPVVVVAQ